MPPLTDESVRIDELTIRVPGLSAAAGLALGERVADLVARQLGESEGTLALGALDLRVRLQQSEITAERIARAVTRAIVERIS